MNIEEWQSKYGDEESCIKFLEKIKWPNGVVCPDCNGNQLYYQKTRRVFQCKSCKHQTSVTAGTIFHSTKLPLDKWFLAIYHFASEEHGISSLKLSSKLNINWRSAHSISNKIRSVMGNNEKKRILSGEIESFDLIIKKGKNDNVIKWFDYDKSIIKNNPNGDRIVVAVEKQNKLHAIVAIQKIVSNQSPFDSILKYLSNKININDSKLVYFSINENANKIKESFYQLNDPSNSVMNYVTDLINELIIIKFRGVTLKYLQKYLYELCYRINNCKANGFMQKLLEQCLTYVRGT